MARNLRPGPDWIPAVVVERLGPLSYLIETEDHDLWRRHIDLLKELSSSENLPITSPASSDADYGGGPPVELSTIPTPDPVSVSSEPSAVSVGESGPQTETNVSMEPTQSSTVESSAPVVPAPTDRASTTPTVTRTYPTRNRRPPDRYEPKV